MIRADENMPELTADEAAEEREFNDYCEWYEREGLVVLHMEACQSDTDDPHADPKCPYCHGTGTVYDSVDYGSTTVQMPSTCECVEVDEDGN